MLLYLPQYQLLDPMFHGFLLVLLRDQISQNQPLLLEFLHQGRYRLLGDAIVPGYIFLVLLLDEYSVGDVDDFF